MLRELRTFIAVTRHGTFAATGERLGLTQSAVSSQIKRLEGELGFALFDRTGRSATLNAAGRDTLVRAEELVTLFSRLGEVPDGDKAQGLLRIGAIASAQSSWLVRALVPFRRQFPEVRLRITPGVSLNLLDQVDAGELDMAIMIRPPFAILPELAWHTLLKEPYVLMVPSRLKGDDWRTLLQTQPFLRYDRSSFGGRTVDRFLRGANLAVQEAIELDELNGMVKMVASGLGVALLPMAESHLPLPRGVRAIRLGDKTFYREIGMVRRNLHDKQALLRPLEDSCRQAVSLVSKRN